MIIINNKVAPFADLSRSYPAGSVERKIIQSMAKSRYEYRFDSSDRMNFEMNVRAQIVQAANDLSQSRLSFAVFRRTRCNPRYWRRTNEGGFVLKPGVKPSDAIKDIYINSSLYATECATGMMIVYYKALITVYGEQQFNSLFPKIQLMNWHYIPWLLAEVGQLRPTSQYLPGDRRYFANPDVNPIHPEWQGENVIDLGNGLYYGHGVGVKSGDQIIKGLNRLRKPNAKRSAYLMDKVGKPDFNKLYNAKQKSFNQSYQGEDQAAAQVAEADSPSGVNELLSQLLDQSAVETE